MATESPFSMSNPMLMMGLSLLANPRNPGQSLLAGASIANQAQRNEMYQADMAAREAERQQQQSLLAQQAEQRAHAASLLPEGTSDAVRYGVAQGMLPLSEGLPQSPEPTAMMQNIEKFSALDPSDPQRQMFERLSAPSSTNIDVNTGNNWSPTQEVVADVYKAQGQAIMEKGLLAREALPPLMEAKRLVKEIKGMTGPITPALKNLASATNWAGSESLESLDSLLTGIANRAVMQYPGIATDEDFKRALKETGSISLRGAALERAIDRQIEQNRRYVGEQKRYQDHIGGGGDIFQYDYGGGYEGGEASAGPDLSPDEQAAVYRLQQSLGQ